MNKGSHWKTTKNHARYWLGKKKPPFSKETRLKMSKAKKGKKQSFGHIHNRAEARRKSLLAKGEKHWNWKGGITPERKILYFSKEYKLWRTAVFERDNYTCVWCGQKGYELNADHIKPWADYPELRFAIDNGRTLCLSCHRKTNSWGKHKERIKE